MGRTSRKQPRELTRSWPDEPSSDPIGELARQFRLNLYDAMDGQSVRSVARDAGINHVTLMAIIEGRTWPDMATIGKLERGLNFDIWPGRGYERARRRPRQS